MKNFLQWRSASYFIARKVARNCEYESNFLKRTTLKFQSKTDFINKRKLVYAGIFSFLGFNNSKEETKEDPITGTVKSAILSIQKGDLVRADRLLHVALQQAQVARQEDAVTHIYSLMANLAFERKLFKQAEKLFTTVIQRLLSHGEAEDSNAIVEISLKIAQIFQANGENQKAEQGYKYCVECQKRKVETHKDDDTLALYGMSLDMLAQFYLSINKLSEAENLWREAVKIGTAVHGENGEQVLVVTNSLATVISMQAGREAEASALMETIIETAQRINSPHTSSFLVNLGLVKMKQGFLEVAKRKCADAKRKALLLGDDEVVQEADNCLQQADMFLAQTKA